MKNVVFVGIVVVTLLNAVDVHALQEVKSISSTDHIKELVYNPNSVHKYIGYFNYQSSIVFEIDEIVDTISMGSSTGWQLTPHANRLFLKPVEDNAVTNATIITNKRVYHFTLDASEASGVNDPSLAYEVRFRYPEDRFENTQGVVNSVDGSVDGGEEDDGGIPDIAESSNLNFKYRVSGYDRIKPLKIFDNGKFTYMQFPRLVTDLPAVFAVENDGYESLVNFRVRGDYIILEQVGARFTLRSGEDSACVFNDAMEFIKRDASRFSLFSK